MIKEFRLAVFIVAALVVGACGVPLDDEPQIIASEELPEVLQPGTSTTSTLPDRTGEEVVIYLVDPGDGEPSLVPVDRLVASEDAETNLEVAVLEQLLSGPTSEEQLELNLTTAVVSSEDAPLAVLEVARESDTQIVVVLSAAPAIEGSDRLVTFAQLVYTLTEVGNVDEVRFVVRNEAGVNEEISVRTDTEEGDVRRPVDRSDYLSLFPT